MSDIGKPEGRLTKAADRFLGSYRLTLAQFNLLTVLMAEPEGLPQFRLGGRPIYH